MHREDTVTERACVSQTQRHRGVNVYSIWRIKIPPELPDARLRPRGNCTEQGLPGQRFYVQLQGPPIRRYAFPTLRRLGRALLSVASLETAISAETSFSFLKHLGHIRCLCTFCHHERGWAFLAGQDGKRVQECYHPLPSGPVGQ